MKKIHVKKQIKNATNRFAGVRSSSGNVFTTKRLVAFGSFCIAAVVTYYVIMVVQSGIGRLDMLKGSTSSLFAVHDTPVYADAWSILSTLSRSPKESVIIDLRSKNDYRKIHLQNTVNVPYPYVDADPQSIDAFVKGVEKVSNGKRIILLPYSTFSTTGTEAAAILMKHGISAEVLSVGWNELYNLPNMWMPESEWDSFSIIDLIEGV